MWQFASSLSREAILKYCFRNLVKLPALTREGGFYSDQVGRQAFGTLVTSSHKQRKEHKKRGETFYSLQGPRPVYLLLDGAHHLRGGR